jgi:beta-glucosidase
MTTTSRFPAGFLWGAATSAHQVEGDNIHSDWWAWEQLPGRIQRGEKSGRACDHWVRFREDFALCRAMGHNAHRLTFEWARIEPREGLVDENALAHYAQVLDALAASGLEPVVTIHHFTSPQWFAQRGGFLERPNLAFFDRHCRRVAAAFAGRVRLWCTINEPEIYAMMGYLFGWFAPGVRRFGAFRRVLANLLRAHAMAYQAIKEANPAAQVGLAKNMPCYRPFNPRNPLDRFQAWQHDQLYNESILRAVRTGRILPPYGDGTVTPGLAGSADFWGLNYYNQSRCRWNQLQHTVNSEPGHRLTQTAWAPYPPGLNAHLLRLARFGLPIYVTENGLATDDDPWRCAYLIEHLRQIHAAISHGADVRGYFYWSLLDNFEWEDGWAPKFGLVAFDPPTFARQPKPSSRLFGEIAGANAVTAEMLAAHPWDMTSMDRADRPPRRA